MDLYGGKRDNGRQKYQLYSYQWWGIEEFIADELGEPIGDSGEPWQGDTISIPEEEVIKRQQARQDQRDEADRVARRLERHLNIQLDGELRTIAQRRQLMQTVQDINNLLDQHNLSYDAEQALRAALRRFYDEADTDWLR